MSFFLDGKLYTIDRYAEETDPFFSERSSFILWFRNDPAEYEKATIHSFHHANMMFLGVSYTKRVEQSVADLRAMILKKKKELGEVSSLPPLKAEKTKSQLVTTNTVLYEKTLTGNETILFHRQEGLRNLIEVILSNIMTDGKPLSNPKHIKYFRNSLTGNIFFSRSYSDESGFLNPFTRFVPVNPHFLDGNQLRSFTKKYLGGNASRLKIDWDTINKAHADIWAPKTESIRIKMIRKKKGVLILVNGRPLITKEYSMAHPQYARMKKMWTKPGEDDFMHSAMALIIHRYDAIGGHNYQLAAPIMDIYPERIRSKAVEMFGSPINTVLDLYLSAFPEIEYMFGSKGSVWETKLVGGLTYLYNPVYTENVMYKSAVDLIKALDETPGIRVFGSMPAWGLVKIPGAFDFGKSPAIEAILGSKHLKKHVILKKGEHVYHNWFLGKPIHATNTLFIFMSNIEGDTDEDFDLIVKNWKEYSKRNNPKTPLGL